MSLDQAIAEFRAKPNLDTATEMLDTARDYASDKMISWDEVEKLCDEARETLAIRW